MKKGNKSNSIATKFSVLKAVYNKALAEGIFTTPHSPFLQFKIGRLWTATRKRAIRKEDVQRLMQAEIPADGSAYLDFARDIFLFSYLSAGINFKDIATLRYCDMDNKCSSLTSIEIPASVETIKASAFKGCSSLATVTFENGSQLKTIEGGYPSSGTFADCTALTSIEIPASVETIEAAAFKGCSSLATVTFEKGSQLKTIGGGGSSYYGAFGQLKNLMTVDMSACTQVKTIGESAFDGDSELRLFKIGTETPPTCGRDAFSGINPYSVLKVPSGCADAYKAKSGWNNFASITGLDE